jgi:hypothetical protein
MQHSEDFDDGTHEVPKHVGGYFVYFCIRTPKNITCKVGSMNLLLP